HVDEIFRAEYARVVASVLRLVRDIDTAEEVVQEAFAQALARWPATGAPERPGAWRLPTGGRRALDRLRSARRADARAGAIAYEVALGAPGEPEVVDPQTIPDDRLRLVFTCCHPALPAESRVALTLRLVGGLSTVEIARAFLVAEPTIAQRLVRAYRTSPVVPGRGGADRARGAVPAAGGDRRLSRARGRVGRDGLAAHRGALREARRRRALAGRGAESRGRRRHGRGTGGRAGRPRSDRRRGVARLSSAAIGARRLPAPARPARGGGRRVPCGAAAGGQHARARVSRHAPGGVRSRRLRGRTHRADPHRPRHDLRAESEAGD